MGHTVDDEIGNHFGKVYNIFCDNVGKRKYRLDDKVKKVASQHVKLGALSLTR